MNSNNDTDFDSALGGRHAEAMVRLIESSLRVHRRYQFFVWSQSHLQTLVPHKLMVCGAYQRPRKEVVYEALHSVPVPQPVLGVVTDRSSPLMQQIVGAWLNNRCRAFLFDLSTLEGVAASAQRDLLIDAGFGEVLVHGVSRPQRPADIETLFVLGSLKTEVNSQHCLHLDLLMPHLHLTYQRVVSTERELAASPAAAAAASRNGETRSLITEREKQILAWVREGKSNHEIGILLDISALTVKNHVQRILRKLDAANRAQAVAKAIVLNLLGAPVGGAASNTHVM